MVVPWICVSISKFAEKPKKTVFCNFRCPPLKKIQTILIRPILKFDALPIAHFEDNVPNFSKHMLKLAFKNLGPSPL